MAKAKKKKEPVYCGDCEHSPKWDDDYCGNFVKTDHDGYEELYRKRATLNKNHNCRYYKEAVVVKEENTFVGWAIPKDQATNLLARIFTFAGITVFLALITILAILI